MVTKIGSGSSSTNPAVSFSFTLSDSLAAGDVLLVATTITSATGTVAVSVAGNSMGSAILTSNRAPNFGSLFAYVATGAIASGATVNVTLGGTQAGGALAVAGKATGLATG